MRYSIIIPAYNESRRIERTLQNVLAYVAQQRWNAEVIIVDDGSCDDTPQKVLCCAQNNPALKLIENPGNRGKGYSVRNGMLHAVGDVMLLSDADLSAPIQECSKLFEYIKAEAADVAIGSRWIRPELQLQRQSLHRQIFGRIFNFVLRVVLGMKFKDTQCGFKAFSRHAVDSIFPLQKIERWAFDPEILFLAEKKGLQVVEVPVQWAHAEGGSIHPVRDGLRMLLDVAKVRWYWITGKYLAAARTSAHMSSESRARPEPD